MKMENIKYREHYLRKIEPFMGTSLIKVMTGQRRVGKSYILFQLIELIRKKESEANIIYINLEDIAFDFIKSAKELYAYERVRIIYLLMRYRRFVNSRKLYVHWFWMKITIYT